MFEQLSLGTKAKKRTDELNAIVAAARHERDELDALFQRLDGRGGKLAEVSTTVEHVRDRAIGASEQLGRSPRASRTSTGESPDRGDWRASRRDVRHRAAGPAGRRSPAWLIRRRTREASRGDGAARGRVS